MSRVARLLDWNCKRAASIAVDQIAPLNCHRENMAGDDHVGLGASEGLLIGMIVQQGMLTQHRAVGR